MGGGRIMNGMVIKSVDVKKEEEKQRKAEEKVAKKPEKKSKGVK